MPDLNEYLSKLRSLENYLDFAIDVTDQTMGRQNVPWRLVRAHQLYNRMTVSCMSFVHLLPMNRPFKTSWEFWDFFSIASLARNILENCQVFFYIGVEQVSKPESDFRLEIFQYHMHYEKLKLYTEFGESPDNLKGLTDNLSVAKERIKDNPLFKAFDHGLQKSILKGNEFMYLSREEISERLPFKTDETTPMYRLLSNHTHATPLAFFSQSNERGRGVQNEVEVDYICLCIDLVTKYLLAAILDLINLFPDCESRLHSEKLRIVRGEFSRISS